VYFIFDLLLFYEKGIYLLKGILGNEERSDWTIASGKMICDWVM